MLWSFDQSNWPIARNQLRSTEYNLSKSRTCHGVIRTPYPVGLLGKPADSDAWETVVDQ